MLSPTRWNPWTELAGLHRELDSMFNRVFGDTVRPQSADSFAPAADVRRDDDKWQMWLALPGISPDKVEINVITANEWYTKVYKAHDFQATLQEHVNHRDIVFYGNPDFYWGYNNPKVVDLIKASEAAATTDEQTAKLREANTIIAEDAASDWLYLYPQIVVSSSAVSGYPVNGLNSQFFAYGIKKSEQ